MTSRDWKICLNLKIVNLNIFKTVLCTKLLVHCGKMYIGKSGRCLKTRINEHMKTSGTNITEVGQRLADNPTCAMSFEDVQGISL